MAQEPIDLAEYRKRREKKSAVSWRARLFGGSEPSLGPAMADHRPELLTEKP